MGQGQWIEENKLDLMAVQVRWDKGGNESAIINGGEFSLHKRILLAILTVYFGSVRMSYVMLEGTGVILYFWFDLRKLNVVKVREPFHIKIWKSHAALEISRG